MDKVTLNLSMDEAEILADLLKYYPHCMGASEPDQDMDSERLLRKVLNAIKKGGKQ